MFNKIGIEIELFLNRSKNIQPNFCVPTLLLDGEKGAGKTFLTETITNLFCGKVEINKNYFFYQCHRGTSPAHFMYDINVHEAIKGLTNDINNLFLKEWVKKQVNNPNLDYSEQISKYANLSPSTISKGILIQVCEKSLKEKVVLVLDEMDKTDRDVDAFLLDFLQNFRIIDPINGMVVGNKSNCLVIFTSNGERLFSEPLYRRMVTVHVPFPDKKELLNRTKNNISNIKIKDVVIKAVIDFVISVRELNGLFYLPGLSEIMTILVDMELVGRRKPEELEYFIVRACSPDEGDRALIYKSKKTEPLLECIAKNI